MRTGYVCRIVVASLVAAISLQSPAALAASSCNAKNSAAKREHAKLLIKGGGKRLDQMARHLEKYGTASISSPLLTPPDNVFAFSLAATPDNYYTSAREESQVKSAGFSQSVSQFGLGVDATVDPLAAAAYAQQLAAYRRDQEEFERGRQAKAVEDNYKRSLLERAVRLEGQKFVDELPEDATPAQRQEAMAKRDRYIAEHLPSTTATAPIYPDAPEVRRPEGDLTAPRPDAALGALSSKQLTSFLGLLDKIGGAPTKLANRAAINIAAGDAATEAIFSVLGRREEASKFKDKKVMFGVSMVSVNPGWHTREGFAADVAMTVQYEYVPVSKERLRSLLENPGMEGPSGECMSADVVRNLGLGKRASCLLQATLFGNPWDPEIPASLRFQGAAEAGSPLVAGVSPMTDAEVFDDAYSQRQQRSIAMALGLALSGSGYQAQAKSFFEYANNEENDSASRQAVAAVNSYSHSGGVIGFQVGPRHRASRGGNANGTLDRQTFPVLMVIGMEQADLLLKFAHQGGGSTGPLVAYEPMLRLCQSSRWSRMEPPRFFVYRRWLGLADSSDLLKWADRIHDVESIADDQDVKNLLEILNSARKLESISDLEEVRLVELTAILKRLLKDSAVECKTGIERNELDDLLKNARAASEKLQALRQFSLMPDTPAEANQDPRPQRFARLLDLPLTALSDTANVTSKAKDLSLTLLPDEKTAVVDTSAAAASLKSGLFGVVPRSSHASAFDTIEGAFLTRAKTMRFLGLGSCNQQSIPTEFLQTLKSDPPRMELVPVDTALAVTLGQSAVVFIRGKNLKADKIGAATIGGVTVGRPALLSDSLLSLTMTGKEAGLDTLAASHSELKITLDGTPVTVGIVRVAKPEAGRPACGFGIERDAAGRVIGVKLFAGSTGCDSTADNYKSLLDAAKAAIAEATDSSLSLSFQGSSSFDASGKQRTGDPK